MRKETLLPSMGKRKKGYGVKNYRVNVFKQLDLQKRHLAHPQCVQDTSHTFTHTHTIIHDPNQRREIEKREEIYKQIEV